MGDTPAEFTIRVTREASGRYVAAYSAVTPVGTISGATPLDYATAAEAVVGVLGQLWAIVQDQALAESVLQRVTVHLMVRSAAG